MNLITAKCKSPCDSNEVIEPSVVNPGGWFGKTWLICSSCGFYYIVEADYLSDALDELADSDRFGHCIRIEGEDRKDYGICCQELELTEEVEKFIKSNNLEGPNQVWLDLDGNLTTEQLMEYNISGSGVEYTTDDITFYGDGCYRGSGMPYPCTYYHSDLPEGGLSPLAFQDLEYDIDYCNEESDN